MPWKLCFKQTQTKVRVVSTCKIRPMFKQNKTKKTRQNDTYAMRQTTNKSLNAQMNFKQVKFAKPKANK